ncbi:COG3014 family protein [Kaarinaea lacus]
MQDSYLSSGAWSFHAFKIVFVVSLFAQLCACASYSYSFKTVEQAIAQDDPQQALTVLEKLKGKGDIWNKGEVLYHLNKAMILRMQRQFEASNVEFENAKRLIEQYDSVSLTEQASSFIINDATRVYLGEPFEQVLLHFYAALNYLELGKTDEARVEALQVDLRLRQLNERIKDPVYTEDAFVRYLTGIIYEQLGEWSNAMIAYRKAYEGYQNYSKYFGVSMPKSLQMSLVRLADQQGLNEELRTYKQKFAIEQWQDAFQRRRSGELIFVLNSGLAPVKKEKSVNALAPRSGQFVRVAVPDYQTRADNVHRVKVLVKNKSTQEEQTVNAELVQNIDLIAIKTLESQMPAIMLRAAARAVAKYNVTKQVQQQDQALALLTNIINVLTETADTRSWLTLPKNIYLARAALAPGQYDLKVEFLTAGGVMVGQKNYNDISIEQNKTRYISYHRVPGVANKDKSVESVKTGN